MESYVLPGAEYLQNGDTTCEGVTCLVWGRLIKRLVQHADVYVTIQEKKFASNFKQVSLLDQVSICCRQLSTSEQRSTLRFQDGHFARLAGDVVEVFSCFKVEATLWVDKQCYQDVMVKLLDRPGENLFIDVGTRVV